MPEGAVDRVRLGLGIARSLWIYHRGRARRRAMDALYRPFIAPGDLAFDIGAHVGDRVAAFRRLGARVVALEPQPALAATLRLLFGRDADVGIEAQAVGAEAGTLELHLNLANPTVATGSPAFIAAAAGSPGWEGQRWERTLSVPVTTLDQLIARHGRPAFVKIDVEGLEAAVLAGLSIRLPALSFEFTTIQREVAAAALARCAALGHTDFNAALGESQRFVFAAWQPAAAIGDWLAGLPATANSGDIYARSAA